MPWPQTEFVLKGIYLGLILFVALRGPSWQDLSGVGLATLAGLFLCLGLAAWRKLREGYRIQGRLPAFLLFLLLENPGLVYAGILLGLLVGAYTIQRDEYTAYQLLGCVVGGAALGIVFLLLRHLRSQRRMLLNLALAVALVSGAIALFNLQPELFSPAQLQMLGWLLLMGIPLFYLLTFASLVEESEVEIGAICAALAVSLWILMQGQSPLSQGLVLLVPAAVYYVYTVRVLPGLRVFKHVLRGLSYATVGQFRWALISLTRALQLDPDNRLARQALWSVYRQMDFSKIINDPEVVALLNFELCLEHVGELLQAPPRPEQMHEAQRLIDLVAQQQPAMQPCCDYWRAVASLHQGQYQEAARQLEKVLLQGELADENPHLRSILLPAWNLALMQHREMRTRVGERLVRQPGRRLQAIAAAERQLAAVPEDPGAWDLKRFLYAELTEADYDSAVPAGQAAPHFDHNYARELGQAQLDDPARWRRGVEYLRLAARGLPQQAVSLLVRIAQASERQGDIDGAWTHYRLARDVGHAIGAKNLPDEERQRYFQVLKMLADSAREEGNLDEAIRNYRLYVEYEKAGVETYRQVAELCEQKGDVWAALHATELGLACNSSDKDLLARKDRYYYSVTPEQLRERLDNVGKWFDVTYCLNKAMWALDKGGGDLDMLDWANHLLELAAILKPDSLRVRVLRARVQRQRGELADAIALLEAICPRRPASFGGGDEEEAWFLGCRLLGDLVLHERPDLAVQCFTEFRKSPKSGADTDYKLGVAYENLGDYARAVKCYQRVTAFDGHPLAPEAHEAIDRLTRQLR